MKENILNTFSIADEREFDSLFDRLWPICRSLTGEGFRESLAIINEYIPLNLYEIESGTQVYDWNIPQEWNIKDAYILDSNGNKVVDFKRNNLHVLGYSIPVDKELSLEELDKHLYSLPKQPDAIPYLTSYYKERWGFCLTHNQREELKPGRYRVIIDSELKAGVLNYADCVLPATKDTEDEILLHTYLCHPSMANNELSGPIVSTFLYKALSSMENRKFNYRFVFVPETIGAITYLSQYGEQLKNNCKGGFVLTSCGDDRAITYKKSRRNDYFFDRSVIDGLSHFCKITGKNFDVIDYFPSGSDERQYCSPGFNLPVGSLMRSLVGEYPEYHTSLDKKGTVVTAKALRESVEIYLVCLMSLEQNDIFMNLNPFCEPQLGKRGLYPTLGSAKDQKEQVSKLMYLLNYSDGNYDLLDIAKKLNLNILDICESAEQLEKAKLLRRIRE